MTRLIEFSGQVRERSPIAFDGLAVLETTTNCASTSPNVSPDYDTPVAAHGALRLESHSIAVKDSTGR